MKTHPLKALVLAAAFAALATGCKNLPPREHAWQFWRRPASVGDDMVIASSGGVPGIRNPDGTFNVGELPPPDGTLDPRSFAVNPPEVALTDAPRTPVDGVLVDLATIYFGYDSAQLSPLAAEALADNADWMQDQMRRNSNLEIRIEGHCDERGTEEYNFALGERRAQTVREQLVALGVDPARLHTHSWGETRPAPDGMGSDEQAWSRNRRVEFAVWTTAE